MLAKAEVPVAMFNSSARPTPEGRNLFPKGYNTCPMSNKQIRASGNKFLHEERIGHVEKG